MAECACVKTKVDEFVAQVAAKNPGQPEFIQAVEEVIGSVMGYVLDHPQYIKAKILERMVEPERVIMFRVPWVDDKGELQINRGYRIQMNSAIGPYKGGLRLHPSVNLGILKFLAFEQVFKNSLTTLSMGGGKGGSDFDPKGKSDLEVMRFCQSFMSELVRYIGPDIDVPAGDIGTGAREIGYLFGQYRKMTGRFAGVLTGKGLEWGGSLIRPEATGYGCVYFAKEMLAVRGEGFEGKTACVSGSGNVAQFTVEKLNQFGAKVLTMSDSNGTIYDPAGIDAEKLAWVKDLKNVRRGRIREYADQFAGSQYLEGQRPWGVACNLAFPCATQNEVSAENAQSLVDNGCMLVAEGANMPTVPAGIEIFQKAGLCYAPGKASNAGGVATSGLEMCQNYGVMKWTAEEVDRKLHGIMISIHENCVKYGKQADGSIDYVRGANIAGFVKVANAMLAQGVI